MQAFVRCHLYGNSFASCEDAATEAVLTSVFDYSSNLPPYQRYLDMLASARNRSYTAVTAFSRALDRRLLCTHGARIRLKRVVLAYTASVKLQCPR